MAAPWLFRSPPHWSPGLLLGAAAAMLVGAVSCFWLPLLPGWPWLGLVLLLAAFCASRGSAATFCMGVFLFAFAWTGLHARLTLSAQLPPGSGKSDFQLQGRIVGLPDHEVRRTRFLLRVDDGSGQPAMLRGKRVQLSWYDDSDAVEPGPRMQLHAGERWRFSARLRPPRGLRNPGGFDGERNALAQWISATGYVRGQDASRLTSAAGLDAWRGRMSEHIARAVSRTSSRYVQAMALGDTRALDDRDWSILRANGLTHLIAISGFHVGMVAGFFAWLGNGVWWLFPRLGRRWPRPQAAALTALVGAVGYAAVAGFALPTVRTALMIGVVVLARLWRRPARVSESLALALVAILLIDPLALLGAGFWLSFAGVGWLIWCLPKTSGGLIRDFLSAQGVASLGLLPLTVVLFGQASLLGPLANLLAIPWWTFSVVPLSLIGLALEAVRTGTGEWAWNAAAWCFDLSWPLFEWAAHSRYALWWLPESGDLALVLALAGAFWMLLPRAVPGRALAALLWLPLLWPARGLPAAGAVELTVLDVGQGLAVLVRTQHHALLYDAGPAVRDGYDAGERVVVPALRALGTMRLQRMVISHGDADHAGGAGAVLATIPTGGVAAPAGMPGLLEATACEAGRGWRWDGVDFHFLHPPPHFPYLKNESSCVLRIGTAHGAALLFGDIGEVIEQRLLTGNMDDLRAEVVLAPHHGSAGSSSPGLVRATGARLVVMSTGHDNRFGHPRNEVVERWRASGAEVLDTSQSGAVRIWIGPDGLALRERRLAPARWWDSAGRQRAAAILSPSE